MLYGVSLIIYGGIFFSLLIFNMAKYGRNGVVNSSADEVEYGMQTYLLILIAILGLKVSL